MPRGRRKTSLRARKVPSQERSIQTVEAILDAAAKVLERESLSGYTTNAVAERAGVSIGSLYQYFPSKDALMAALIQRESEKLLKALRASCLNVEPERALTNFIQCAMNHQFERPVFARIIDFEEARLPVHAQRAELIDEALEIMIGIIGGLKKGTAKDLRVAALDVGMIIRGLVDGAGEREETDLDSLFTRVNRAVNGYLFYN